MIGNARKYEKMRLGLEIETLNSPGVIFDPWGLPPRSVNDFCFFSVFQISAFSPEVITIFENFEFSTFRSEEIGRPQRVSRVRKSVSRANSEVSYQTGDLYDCDVENLVQMQN